MLNKMGLTYCQFSSNSGPIWRKWEWRPCPFTQHRAANQDIIRASATALSKSTSTMQLGFKTGKLWWDTPGPDPVHPKIPAAQLVPLIGHLVLLGTPRSWHRHCLHLGAFGAWTRHPHFPSHHAQRVAEVRTVASSGKVSGAPAVEGMYDHRHVSEYFFFFLMSVSAGVKAADLSVSTFTV
jgi:hypothetical protein